MEVSITPVLYISLQKTIDKTLAAFVLLMIALLQSCANISAPTGGEKDVTPPKLIKSYPPKNAKNFQNRILQFMFDERIDIKDLEDQLIINPIPKGNYVANVNKNVVKLTFDKGFNPNTTYTFNFREGIKDVTESNFSQNLQVAFSTGNELDSASLKGRAVNYTKNIFLKDAIISLFTPGDTLDINNSPGIYSTKTNPDGSYEINNIQKGIYNAYAIMDVNKNQLYDGKEELISFKDKLIVGDTNTVNFKLVKTATDTFKILQSKLISTLQNQITFNRGVFKVEASGEGHKILFTQSNKARILNVFYTGPDDSIRVAINAEDSLGNNLQNTGWLQFSDSKSSNKVKLLPPLTYDIIPADRQLAPGKTELRIVFQKPVTTDNTQLVLKQDSLIADKNKITYTWNSSFTQLEIKGNIPFKDTLVMNIPYGNFIGIEGDSIYQSKEIFTYKNDQNFASLQGRINTTEKNYQLQLLNSQYEVIESLSNPKEFLFNYIPPGSYYLRAFADQNNNKRWDTSDLIGRKQPEPIYFYKSKFDLRANWEIRDLMFAF